MGLGGDKGAPTPDPAGWMAQAAASLSTAAWRQALALSPGAPAASADGATRPWVERMLLPYRQFLGAFAAAAAVPRMLERVTQVLDASAGQQLLFRARPRDDDEPGSAARTRPAIALSDAECKFYDFVDACKGLERPLMSQALRSELQLLGDRAATQPALDDLQVLTRDPRRTDLPRLLDELKQGVRADRVTGFHQVHDALQWLLQADGRRFSDAYVLLQCLSDLLGEACLREVRLRRLEAAYLSPPAALPSWEAPLRACFATFGVQLSARVSVVACGSPDRPDLLVMDHGQDRCFEVRRGVDPGRRSRWCGGEVHGAEPGRDHDVGGQRYKLPLRVHDACQGFGTWLVDRRAVQESDGLIAGDTRLAMRPWDIGSNRTPVTLFFIHYRDSDAGEYYELGLGAFVSPDKDPLSVGVTTLGALLVSTPQARDVGREIWGYRKEHVDASAWTVSYRPDHVACTVRLEKATLRLRLPRGGMALASALPLLMYERKPADGNGSWHRIPQLRFASGEALCITGAGVELAIDVESSDAFLHPLLANLYRLGLVDAGGRMRLLPQYSAWAERVSSHLGSPTPVPHPAVEFN